MVETTKKVVHGKVVHSLLGPLCSALGKWRGVMVQSKAGGASFLIGKKVFAFTRSEGIALKLPEARIRLLLQERDATFLVMGKRTMREWLSLRLGQNVGNEDLARLREAMEFVAGKKS